MPFHCTIVWFVASAFAASQACADSPAPIRTLIITGHNNHNWRYTSQFHKDTLEATGRFVVDITDSPDVLLTSRRAVSSYPVFVLDYNDLGSPKRWGEVAERNFLEAVRNGAGVVAIHSANNAFDGWTEYEKMLGLLWRENAGHGDFHAFNIQFAQRDHPITSGLADFINHPDELYHRLSNPQNATFQILATAHSAPEHGGTAHDEPVAITLNYGSGRVFATTLGHVWTNQPHTKSSIVDPQFKILLCRAAEWAATGTVTLGTTWNDSRTHNHVTDEEQQQGWRLLFDGKVADAFRGFKQEGFPQTGWVIQDGAIVHHANPPDGSGGDLITADQFTDFEFSCQWKVARGGNSGIIYRCSEDHSGTWETGLEMQILDDEHHRDGSDPKKSAGALYGLFPCQFDVVRPAGEWNQVRIVAHGSRIEHWVNGWKVIDCDLQSDEFAKAKAASKFNALPDFATHQRGHIALQDHGDEVQFRDLKVRLLNVAPQQKR